VTFDSTAALAWVASLADLIEANAARLTDLDAAIGDGDHGFNLVRGFSAARKVEGDTPGAVLAGVGRTLVSTVGGASGPLYGTFFRRVGKALGDEAAADAAGVGAALEAGVSGLQQLGKAEEGDKTMIDAMAPAVRAYQGALDGHADLAGAALAAVGAAREGAAAAVPLQARKGRASYLGERSKDHADPGAESAVLLFEALAQVTGGTG
jgi:dihydroxyacetone kinase-like protein